MDASTAMDRFFNAFQGDSQTLQFIGLWGYRAFEDRDLVQMYIHLILAALFPIYIGSHASLRRPPSAASPKKQKAEESEDDEIEVEPVVEGLSPSDAIMFPVLAGITLGGLYLIIKWLKDPALLNKILGWYFSVLGVFGVGKLSADGLNVVTSFIFPSVWSSSDQTFYVDQLLSQQVTGRVKKARVQVHRKFAEGKTNPFPGVLSSISFSKSTTQKLWSLRALLRNHWIFRGYLHGVFGVKTKVQLNDAVGFVIGVAAVTLYNVNGKAWWLTNLIGMGFCYGTLQIISPTTFWTGSLVLLGLFIYDITMVFYTPLMVTVATSLDVPIKLVFPGPKRGGMLGLGDVVLPGIMMALALRFDLYRHYLRKQHGAVKSPESSTTPFQTGVSDLAKITKPPYIDASGAWGERFWTRRAFVDVPTVADAARFSKVYFKASLVGYVIGMLVTLVVLNAYNHAQPALLYLVPGVLIALWGTALVRGELKTMWDYTEDGSLDQDDDKAEKKTEEGFKESTVTTRPDSNGNGSLDNASAGSVKNSTPDIAGSDMTAVSNGKVESKKVEEHAHHVFLFSLSSPKQGLPKKAKLFEKS